MNWWIGNVSSLMADPDGSALISQSETPPPAEWSYIFSVFTYKSVCVLKNDSSAKIQYIHIPIEPTAAIARDPRKVFHIKKICII